VLLLVRDSFNTAMVNPVSSVRQRSQVLQCLLNAG